MAMPHRVSASPLIYQTIVRLAGGAILSSAVWGCSGQAQYNAQPATPLPPQVITTPQPVAATPHPAARTKVTTASFYAPELHGHPTSSGEIYDKDELTAASRTLPIGSRAKVTNLKTGKSVSVRINDHGPFVHGRGIDLSTAAAKRIGIDGTAKVAVTPIKRPAKARSHRATNTAKPHDAPPVDTASDAGPTMPPVMESSIIPTSPGSTLK